MGEWTREAVIALAKKVGEKHGGTLTGVQLRDEGGVTFRRVDRLFPKGGRLELRRAAGLERAVYPLKVQPERALEEYHRVARKLGGVPSWSLFKRHGRFGPEVLIKRFGGRARLWAAYDRWLKARGEKRPGPLLSRKTPRAVIRHLPDGAVRGTKVRENGIIRKAKETLVGAPMEFGGLLHEPTNEAGVVFLFGALAREMGFLVDGFRPTFPDCEAKRLVNRTEGRWARVLIEFEFRSSNFLMHGHDANGCDLIVCWEDDWKDCPVEVVELKREIGRMRGERRAA